MDNKKTNKRLIHGLLATAVVIVISVLSYAFYRAEYIQYKEIGAEYLKVFNTNILERALIFAVTFVFVYISVMLTNRRIKKGLKKHFEKEGKKIPKLINNGAAVIFAAISAFLVQEYLAGQILTLLNMGMFGKKDPIFGFDYGIFIIGTPIIKNILKALLIYLVVLAIYVTSYNIIVTNKYLEGIEFAEFGKHDLIKHLLNLLIKATIVVVIYNVLSHQDILIGDMLRKESFDGIYLTGAGFIDVNVKLWAYRIVTLLIIYAVWKFIKGVKKQDSKQILISIVIVPAAIITTFLLLVAVDYLFVRGNELEREKTYIENNINATQEAYNIKVENKEISGEGLLTKEKINSSKDYINNINIVTPDVILETLKNKKDLNTKVLYKYGEPNLVKDGNKFSYVTPREIDYKKEKTYTDKLYKYTHGNFGVVTDSSSVDKNGYILNKDQFEKAVIDGKEIKEPRIYYGMETVEPAIVNSKYGKEFDYQKTPLTSEENVYQGQGGVKVNIIDRIALAISTKKTSVLFTTNYTDETKLLLNRQLHQRLKKILPSLKYDNDPYLVTKQDGTIAWVVDAYTVTNRYPYAQKIAIEAEKGGRERINYIRNSVKVLVDPYNGTVEFYVVDKTDPFIATIEKIYPGVLKNYSELNEEIKKQIKYPKYLFDIQSKMISTYHGIGIDTLYREDDRWDVSEVSYTEFGHGEKSTYSLIKNQGEKEKLGLLTTFTPAKKKNIVSYLFGETNNGENKLTMYRYNTGINELSLGFIDAEIEKDKKIQEELKELQVLGTELKTRRTIIPFENTTIYIKQIYQVFLNEDSSVPVLKKIIVANKGKVAIGDTLQQAMLGLLTENAIDIDIRDLEDPEVLVEAIIKQNESLKNSVKENDFEYIGKDIKNITKLIDKLNEAKKVQKEKELKEAKEEKEKEEITEKSDKQENIQEKINSH